MTLSSHNPSIYDDMVQKRCRWSVLLNHVKYLTFGHMRFLQIKYCDPCHVSGTFIQGGARSARVRELHYRDWGHILWQPEARLQVGGHVTRDTWHVTRVSPASNYLCIPASPTPTTLPPRSTGGPWTTSGTSQISSRRDCTTFIGASWGTGEAESEHLHFVDIVC